jgi:hypothetical protein
VTRSLSRHEFRTKSRRRTYRNAVVEPEGVPVQDGSERSHADGRIETLTVLTICTPQGVAVPNEVTPTGV